MTIREKIFVQDHPGFVESIGEKDSLQVHLKDKAFLGHYAWHDAARHLDFRFDKPSGWKGKKRDDSTYYTKSTKYGVKYKCKWCGKESLGIGAYNHWRWCHSNKRGQ